MDYSIAANLTATTTAGRTQPVAPASRTAPASAASTEPAADRVELSDAARLYSRLPQEPFRADKVAEIKSRLADGSYLHPDQLDAAVEGLLRDVNLLA